MGNIDESEKPQGFTMAQLELTLRNYTNYCVGLCWRAKLDNLTTQNIASFGIVALLMHLGVQKTAEIEYLIKMVIQATCVFYYNRTGSLRPKPLEGAVIAE